MNNTKKVYVVGNDISYTRNIYNCEITNDITKADIVMFTGGEDVDPSLYGCTKHRSTYSNINRDMYEKEIFEKIHPDQLVVSICRGSQFTCVMNGGLLVQHCTGHAIGSTHRIYSDSTNKVFDITSTHHQMQYPYNLDSKDYTILYRSIENLSNSYEGDKIDPIKINKFGEPEIVLYHKPNMPKCLAIQGHPEYMLSDSAAVIEINNIIDNLLNEKG